MKSQYVEGDTNVTLLLNYYWRLYLLLYGIIVRDTRFAGFLFDAAHMLALSPGQLFAFRLNCRGSHTLNSLRFNFWNVICGSHAILAFKVHDCFNGWFNGG
jgi:hypothetical protein